MKNVKLSVTCDAVTRMNDHVSIKFSAPPSENDGIVAADLSLAYPLPQEVDGEEDAVPTHEFEAGKRYTITIAAN